MLALKYLLMIVGIALFGSSGAVVAYDIYLSEQLRRLLAPSKTAEPVARVATTSQRPFHPLRWKLAEHLAVTAIVPILLSLSIMVVPNRQAGVRTSVTKFR